MSNLDAALSLAALGWHVFPCRGEGKEEELKKPLVGWRGVSTTDPRAIRAWWHSYPTAVPGVDMGKSELIAIDCDCKHSDGQNWVTTLGVDMIKTPGSDTPSGGRHLIYRNPHGFTNGRGSLPGKEVADVDIRGKGGYIIGPGSQFADGRVYSILGDLSAIEDLPQVFVDYLSAAPAVAKVAVQNVQATVVSQVSQVSDYRVSAWARSGLDAILSDIAGLPSGNRQDPIAKLAWKAGQLVDGIPEAEIVEAIENTVRGWYDLKPGYLGPKGTVQRQVAEGARNPRRPTDRVENVLQFPGVQDIIDEETGEVIEEGFVTPYTADWTRPAGILGEMADWILASSRRPNRPLAVAAAVSVLSAFCGRWLYAPTGTALNVYITALAGTSIGKDRPLSAIQEIMVAAKYANIQTSAKGFSVSAFEQMVVDHPCCIATVDEIGANLISRMGHKKASTHEAGIKPMLLELWSREDGKGPFHTTRHARKQGETGPTSIAIERPSLSLFGTSTPEAFYDALKSGSVSDGFLNRFLMVEASEMGERQRFDAAARAVPISISNRLRALVPVCGLGVFNRNQDITAAVRRMEWEDEAVELRSEEFEDEILERMRAAPRIAPLLGRVFEYAVRLASLHAISRTQWAKVTLEDLEWGIAWSTQSAQLMIRGAAMYMADSEHQAMAKDIKRRLAGGELSRTLLIKALDSKYRIRDLNECLALMVEGGEVRLRLSAPGAKGGRTGAYYSLR